MESILTILLKEEFIMKKFLEDSKENLKNNLKFVRKHWVALILLYAIVYIVCIFIYCPSLISCWIDDFKEKWFNKKETEES